MAKARVTDVKHIISGSDIHNDQYEFTCMVDGIDTPMYYVLDRFPAAKMGDFTTHLTPAMFIDFCKRCDFSVDYTVYACLVVEYMTMYYDQAKLKCGIFSEEGIRALADAFTDCVDDAPNPNDFPTLDLLREVIYDNLSS